VRKILPLFGFVHAVDSLDLAEMMDRIAGELGLRPKVFLQVNLATEQSKGGFGEAELRNSMDRFAGLKYVNPVGLMTIPPAADDAEESRHWFMKLRQLRDELTKDHDLALPYLSMGMSGDFEIAIEEGATHVRVGSAIFGKREYKIEGELG
jgi:pyridoxal phosphate enzyme (YggS family)